MGQHETLKSIILKIKSKKKGRKEKEKMTYSSVKQGVICKELRAIRTDSDLVVSLSNKMAASSCLEKAGFERRCV